MLGQPFRLPPQGPAAAYQTFSVVTPPGPDHWRPASCEEVDCEFWANGWQTRVPRTAGAMLNTIRTSGRPYLERVEEAEVVFTFGPGTTCFRASTHQVKLGRPELFIVRDGDWRGNPTGTFRRHTRPDDWVEHMQDHLGKLREQQERG